MEYRWDPHVATKLGDETDQLVHLSNLIGADPALIQPGGGNTSVKRREKDFAGRDIEMLRVKGSGTDLATIDRKGFTGLRLEDVRLLRRRGEMTDEAMMAFLDACRTDPKEPVPSVETPLHSVLPYRFIVHTHDYATQALTDTLHPEDRVRETLGREVAYLRYVRPGYPLARAVMEMGSLGEALGLILDKHGLVTWGETAQECYGHLHRIINRVEEFLAKALAGKNPFGAVRRASFDPARRRSVVQELLPALRGWLSRSRKVILHFDDSEDVLRFVGSERARELSQRGVVTPEHILRCGRLPLYVEADLASVPAEEGIKILRQAVDRYVESAEAAFARHGQGKEKPELHPRVVLLPGLGMVTAMKDKRNALVGAQCYRHVIRVVEAAEALEAFRFLDEPDAVAIECWPLETAKLKQPEKDLSRRVALVTGGANGIGRAVAERLALEGAHVAIADLDGEAARKAAEEIGRKCKDPARTRAVKADVTDEREVQAAFDDLVLAYGGLDILVCNAGFVQAGSIDRIEPDVWDRHFDVNVKGYWLATRAAARIMKVQGGGAIVFNASKGAFAPTVDNAAYATSKAAVAALARNLAVELAPFAIRVNYFNADFVDTPLMRRLVAQRAELKGISYEAQAEEYRRRNLLKVGPIPPEAVAETVLFLASDRSLYTTGGVIPIDGGLPDAMAR